MLGIFCVPLRVQTKVYMSISCNIVYNHKRRRFWPGNSPGDRVGGSRHEEDDETEYKTLQHVHRAPLIYT